MNEATKEKIIELIEEVLMTGKGSITEYTTMDEVKAWDSLAHVLLIGELEARLGIVISLDEAIEINSVKDILDKAGV